MHGRRHATHSTPYQLWRLFVVTPQGRRTVVKGTHVISRHTAWIEEVAEQEEAWRQLDEQYGSNHLAELSTMYPLELLKLLKGSTTRKATHIYAGANNADIQPSASQVGCKQKQTHNKMIYSLW